MKDKWGAVMIAAVAAATAAGPAWAIITQLEPSKDNTLYQSASGNLSNGAGEYLFAGYTVSALIRRGVIAFESMPTNATVNSATLTLHLSLARTGFPSVNISLRRLLADWGEGTSDASDPGGDGDGATTGDATWQHTFYNTDFWTNDGGDFSGTLTATTSVGGVGFYSFFSPQLTADVQAWATNPATNFGWIVTGNESTGGSARRFDSRENFNPANRPNLTVDYNASTWNVNADGNWSSAGNWAFGVPNGIGAEANFLGVILADRTVTVDGVKTVGILNFANLNKYTIAGPGPLILDRSGASVKVEVSSGNHEISAPLQLSQDLLANVAEDSTLRLSGTMTVAAGVAMEKTGAGTLILPNVRADELDVTQGTVQVADDDAVSRVSSLSLSDGTTLDLNDNDLIVDGGSYSVIEADVIEGFNGGDWLGNGITSSAAANDTVGVSALGIIDNAEFGYTEFSGQTGLNSDEILVKHTYYGDADVGGTVNNDDFVQFLAGYNEGAPAKWLNGDFDYNASVNLDDFALFLAGLQDQGDPRVSPELFTNLAEFVASEGIDVDLSTVPEPASAALLALGSLLLARRRRL